MQELKRWMTDLRIWGVLVLVSAACVFGFWKTQTQVLPADTLKEGYQLAESMLCTYQLTEDQDRLMAEYMFYAYSEQSEKKYAYELFSATILRYEEYQKYLENIKKNIKQALLIGGLGEENGYYGKNIRKTEEDFSGMEEIFWEPSLSKSAEVVLQNRLTDIGLLIFVTFTVLLFMTDQKNGMWKLQRCCKNGRVVSLLHCLAALLLWIITGVVLLYLFSYLVSTQLYGETNLSLPVQALEGHQGIPYCLSIRQYGICVMGVKILTFFCFGVCFWLCCILIRKELPAILLFGIAAGAEWILYTKVSYQSMWRFLKVWNLWAGGYRDDLLKTYQNVNLFENAVSVKTAFFAFVISAILIIAVCICLIYAKGYLTEGHQEKRHFKWHLPKILSVTGSAGLEQYKIWIDQKNLILAVIFICWLFTQGSGANLSYDQMAAYKMTLYEQLGGMEFAAQQEALAAEAGTVEQLKEDYIRQQETAESWQQEALKESVYFCEKKLTVIETLEGEAERISNKKSEGYDVRLLNDLGYQMLFTADGISMRQQSSFYLLALLILFTAGSMAYEKQRGMDRLIHTTEKRHNQLFLQKAAAYLPWGAVAIVLVSLKEIVCIADRFGLPGMEYDVQSLKLFEHVKMQMAIWQLILLLILVRIVVGCVIMCAMMWISGRFHKTILAIAAGALLFIVPSFFSITGFYALRGISLSWYLDVIRWMVPLLQ